MQTEKEKTTAFYCRSAIEDEKSIERQKAQFIEYAEHNGYAEHNDVKNFGSYLKYLIDKCFRRPRKNIADL